MSKLFSICLFSLVVALGPTAVAVTDEPGLEAIKETTTTLCEGGGECAACMPGEWEYVYMLASAGTEAIEALTVPVDEAAVADAGSFAGPGSVAPTSVEIVPNRVTWNFGNPLAAGDLSESLFICSLLSPVDGFPFLNGVDGSVAEIACPVPGGDPADPGDVCEPTDDGDKSKKKKSKKQKSKKKSDKKKKNDKKKSDKKKSDKSKSKQNKKK